MGRRINISQPTVINTELVPLTDSFALEPNGQTEQWYYENDGTYAPDRRIVPLVITPKLSAFDKDTNQTYSPNISTIAWYASQWTNGKWVEAEITNISDASQDYYIRQDKALQVSKNLSDAAHGITIRCIATFIDPRDAGITYTEEDTIQLTANKDATVFYPEVDILNETTVTFNPLVDENSHKVFKGKIEWTSITRLNPNIAEYYANPSGTEQMLPDNATDVTSLSPILDIRYGRESIVSWNQLFTYRQTADGTLAGNERTVTWNQLVQNGDFSDGLTGWSVDSEYAQYVTINHDRLGINLSSPRTVLVTHQGTSDYVTAGHKYYLSATCDNVGYHTCKIGVSDFIVSFKTSSPSGRRSAVGYPTISSLSDKYVTIEAKTTIGLADVNIDDIMLVDLTLMYGEGHEPATSAQFEADFKSIFERELEEYQPFNTGETIVISSILDRTASVRRIQGQSVVWNQRIDIAPASKSISRNGVSIVDNRDGTYTVSTDSNGATANTYIELNAYPANSGIASHKLLVTGIRNSTTSTCVLTDTYSGFFSNLTTPTIVTIPRDNKIYISIYVKNNAIITTPKIVSPQIIDLTLMFGTGNEPETVEEFEAWLAANVGLRDYYPYDAGAILSVKSTGIKTTGFNQWDEEWEAGAISGNSGEPVSGYEDSWIRSKNFTPVIGGVSYYVKLPDSPGHGCYLYPYDANKVYLGMANRIGVFGQTAGAIITVQQDAAFIKIANQNTTYNHDICINISDPNKNGTYEPYFESTSPMEVVTMKGKLNGQGISTVVFPYGMNRVGDVYDEVYVDNGVLKAVKRLGVVDMGTLTWSLRSGYTGIFETWSVDTRKSSSTTLLCSKYLVDGIATTLDSMEDKTLRSHGSSVSMFVKDTAYSDAATFKTGMNGVMLVYELATPEEYVLDPTVDARYFEWYGVKNGAEVKIDTLPCYVSGQGTDTLTIDAMFGENIPVVLRAKRYPWSDSLYPSKAYRNMAWRIPNIDAIVASDRGQAVHSDNDGGYEFDTIINIKKAILDEETKNKHLRFKWWMRNTRNNQAVETSVGWGGQVGIGVEDLRNVRGANNSLASTPVYNEVMLLGAYEEVSYTSGNATEYVTYNGVQLFGRTLE